MKEITDSNDLRNEIRQLVKSQPKSKWKTAGLVCIILLLIYFGFSYFAALKNLSDFEDTMAKYKKDSLEFAIKQGKDGQTIAMQQQAILTEKQAREQGLLQLQSDMKNIQAQISFMVRTGLRDSTMIAYTTPDWYDSLGRKIDNVIAVRDKDGKIIGCDTNNVIKLPKNISKSDKWMNLNIDLFKDSSRLNKLYFIDKYRITLADKKFGFFRFKKSEPTVFMESFSPYQDSIINMNNVIIKKESKWYNSKLFQGALWITLWEVAKGMLRKVNE